MTQLVEMEEKVTAKEGQPVITIFSSSGGRAKTKSGSTSKKGKGRIGSTGDKDAIFLDSLSPSPGSYRDAVQIMASGTLTFEPEKIVMGFYRQMVERKAKTGLLGVKEAYLPTETLVYPDSSIYGEIEPNLVFHAEILTAHYQILDNEQRWLIEQHLVAGKSYSALCATAGKSQAFLSKKLLEGIRRIVRFVYRDYNRSTYTPVRNLLIWGNVSGPVTNWLAG